MPSYVIPDQAIIQVTTRAVLDGQTILNTFHYRNILETDEGVAVIAELLAQFNGTVQTNLAACQADVLTYLPTTAQVIWPTRYIAQSSDQDMATEGAFANPPCPTTVAAVARRVSFFGSKHSRGRIYIAGIPFANVEESKLSVVGLANVNALANTFDASLTVAVGHTVTPIIYRRDNPSLSAVVQGGIADPILRVQRRREVGVGV